MVNNMSIEGSNNGLVDITTLKKEVKIEPAAMPCSIKNDEIIIKEEPIEDDEEEYLESLPSASNSSNNGLMDIIALKEEVKIEPAAEPCSKYVYTVLHQIKDEIKKENSKDESTPFPSVCEVWLEPNQEQYYSENCKGQEQYYSENCKGQEQYYSENCKGQEQYYSKNRKDEPEDQDKEEQPPESLQDYHSDIMPHFLSGELDEADELFRTKVVSCHRCGEECTGANYMEHINLKHRNKPRQKRVLRSKKKKRNERKYVYPCPYCSKLSYSVSQVSTHILTHTQEKPHKCPFCDYKGNQASSINYHIETKHLNMKRYKCELCDYSTSSSQGMKKHKVSHRKKTVNHQCPYCEVITRKPSTLNNHIKKYHRKKNDSDHKIVDI
ncbi:zinc finger protein 711 isoform X1 [Halyomorpha halys]|uniref:zinc finger protein 711 isoform X1 n=3 Tax=Halyomorpha halys TaxID=286706 RepID=UPI0006D4ECBF|nr:zinc finger Y-chromosomal protein 1-like [Halyomorpha halys]